MARRCSAVLVKSPGARGAPVRRCKGLCVGRSAFCVAHQPDAKHFNALLAVLGSGWEDRVPGASDGLTPRGGWEGYKPKDGEDEVPTPEAPPTPKTAPAPAAPAPLSAWERAQAEAKARMDAAKGRTGGK